MIGSWLVSKMFKFEDLRVYNETLDFVNLTYSLTNKWPKDEFFGLTNQLRRAAASVALNIAEGSSRSRKDFRHFLDLSRGSCFECIAILQISIRRGYISNEEYNKFYEYCEKLAKMISALKTSLK